MHYKLYCHQLYHVGNQVSSRLYYLVFIFKWTIGLTRFPQRNIQEKIILIQTQANKKRSWCLWAWVLFPPQDKVVWDTLQWWHSNQNHVRKSAPKHHLNDKCCTWNLNVCHYYKDNLCTLNMHTFGVKSAKHPEYEILKNLSFCLPQ